MRRAFSLVELLIAIAIIAVLTTAGFVATAPARRNARDKTRIANIGTIGRFLLASTCYVPSGGPGDYDLKTLYNEAVAANPALKQFLADAPKDPRLGDETRSGLRYAYDASGRCALYANLENPEAELTNAAVPALTPGASGTLKAAVVGPNGTDRYYQMGR